MNEPTPAVGQQNFYHGACEIRVGIFLQARMSKDFACVLSLPWDKNEPPWDGAFIGSRISPQCREYERAKKSFLAAACARMAPVISYGKTNKEVTAPVGPVRMVYAVGCRAARHVKSERCTQRFWHLMPAPASLAGAGIKSNGQYNGAFTLGWQEDAVRLSMKLHKSADYCFNEVALKSQQFSQGVIFSYRLDKNGPEMKTLTNCQAVIDCLVAVRDLGAVRSRRMKIQYPDESSRLMESYHETPAETPPVQLTRRHFPALGAAENRTCSLALGELRDMASDSLLPPGAFGVSASLAEHFTAFYPCTGHYGTFHHDVTQLLGVTGFLTTSAQPQFTACYEKMFPLPKTLAAGTWPL